MPAPTRDRILDATAELFRRHGYHGTGMKQILQAAQAPFGSLYHHFPGGKEELGAKTILASGRMYGELVGSILASTDDVPEAVRISFEGAAATLEESGYEDACPIATVALEVSSTSEPMREACHQVFEEWLTALERTFAGAEDPRALAIIFLTALEGGFLLCRAARSTEAMLVMGKHVSEVVADALAD